MHSYFLRFSLTFLVTVYGSITSLQAEVVSDSIIFLQEGLADLKKSEKINALDVWHQQVANESNYNIVMLWAPTFKNFLNMIQKQKISYALLDGSNFIHYHSQIKPGLNGKIWMLQRTSNALEEYVLVSKKDNPATDLIDFRNSNFSIYSNYRLLAMYMVYLVKQTAQTTIENFFKQVRHAKSESHSILDVFFGVSDICLVPKHALNDAIKLNPALKDKLKVIHRSGEKFAPAIILALNDVSQKSQNRFNQAIENLHRTARGQQLLSLFGIHAIKKIQHKALNPMLKLNMSLQKLN